MVSSQAQIGRVRCQIKPLQRRRRPSASLNAKTGRWAQNCAAIPIVGRVKDDLVLLDMRGADPMEELIQALQNVELGAK